MANLAQALSDFGHDIGLPLVESGPQGEVQFRLESGALLGIAQVGSSAVVQWAEPVRYGGASLALKAMRRAGRVNDAAQAVQVGLRSTPTGDWLVLAMRLGERDISARRIQEAAEFLRAWMAGLHAQA
jgi:type III secretion system chaperone SycN